MKFCKDCVHCVPGEVDDISFAKCNISPVTSELDLVSGVAEVSTRAYCKHERRAWAHRDSCGPYAKHFQPKEGEQ